MFPPGSWRPTRAILALDARACVREWLQPVLYLAGSRDRVVPSWNAEEVVKEAPSAKVVTIEGLTWPCTLIRELRPTLSLDSSAIENRH